MLLYRTSSTLRLVAVLLSLWIHQSTWKAVETIHPACDLVAEHIKAQEQCIQTQRQEAKSHNITGCRTERDEFWCWYKAEVGQVVNVSCSEVFQLFAKNHVKMPGGSTIRQCPHCLQKINCANRKCTKCGKLLEIKSRQTARMKSFRARAKEWAQQVKKSRNQAKIFDNSALLVEKLKALGYFPLLLWGKYRPQNKKWNAQLQCPFELPLVAHAVLEKILCLFEGLLEVVDNTPTLLAALKNVLNEV